jgi:peptidoglycan/xylan/chitin deacetylase (PgdA/CDA1 family)
MNFKRFFKQPIFQILLIGIFSLLALLLIINRYLFFQKTIFFLDKVDIDWMGYTNQKVVALTFDDGPNPVYTPQLLKILHKYHAPATFFDLGANACQYPELVKAESKAGHLIGNHTYSHPRLSQLSSGEIRAEIIETDDEIEKITHQKPHFFRPPYEELTENILTASRNQHKQIILSTITLEHESAKTPQAKAERVIRIVFPGAIILAHDGRLNRSQTIAALPYLIDGLTAKGYRIVTLKTLLHLKP